MKRNAGMRLARDSDKERKVVGRTNEGLALQDKRTLEVYWPSKGATRDSVPKPTPKKEAPKPDD